MGAARPALIRGHTEVFLETRTGPLNVRLDEMTYRCEVERSPEFARQSGVPYFRESRLLGKILNVSVVVEFVEAFPQRQQPAIQRRTQQTIQQNQGPRADDRGPVHRA